MRYQKKLALLLAVVMALTVTYAVPAGASGTGLLEKINEAGDVSDKAPDISGTDPALSGEAPDLTNITPTAAVEEVTVRYEEDRDTLSLSYRMKSCAYVRISVNGVAAEEKYTKETYDYTNALEGNSYEFLIEPYNVEDIAGEAVAVSYDVPYKTAVVEALDADYNLERKVLILDWSGRNMEYADVYQDDEMIAEKTEGTRLILEVDFEPMSRHTYTVIPYNKVDEAGPAKKYELLVGDYVAKITNLTANYNEAQKKVVLSWSSIYTQYVDIFLNDEEVAEKYTGNSFEISCELQPGASYIVCISPYNEKNKLGEEKEADVSVGYFEVPDDFSAAQVSIPIKDSYGGQTGFSRPLVQLTWEAQPLAVYEIYRADADRTGAYKWIATVKSNVDGAYTYADEKAGFGIYYYKIRRKIVQDPYIDRELYTALSGAREVNALVPKPEITAKLNEEGKIALTMAARKEYVSGYDIYRKGGKGGYRLLATVTGDEYIDEEIEFGETYRYKVKAYYYDIATGNRATGVYSKVARVKNAIGDLEAEIVAVSANKVKLTWNSVANAKEYEVYYRSGMSGDSYTLWQTTRRTTLRRKLKRSGTHSFLIKACQTTKKGKTYFSSAEVSIKMGFSAPTGFQVKRTAYERTVGTNTITQKDVLTWNRVYGAGGYYIDVYNAANGTYERIAKIKGGRTKSYTVRNAVTEHAATVTYRISAYKGNRVKKGGTVVITPKLGAPEDVDAVKSGSQVIVSWSSVIGAERYRVYRSNGRTMLLVAETTATFVYDQGLSAGAPYKYYVYAVNLTEKLTGEKSEPAAITMKQPKVYDLTAINGAAGTVQLTWEASRNADSYTIYYKDSEKAEYKKLANIVDKKMLYLHSGLKRGTTYYYKVVAVQTNCAGILVESDGALAEVKVTK